VRAAPTVRIFARNAAKNAPTVQKMNCVPIAASVATASAVTAISVTHARSVKTAWITSALTAVRAAPTVRRSVKTAVKSAVNARLTSCAWNAASALTVPARTTSA